MVKSVKELRELRSSVEENLLSREKVAPSSNSIEILVGMGTCGLAAGALETYNKINELLITKDIKNVNVVNVGCVGMCHSEPTIQITIPGGEPTIYGNVTENKVEALLDAVLKGDTCDDLYLTKCFKKAVV